VLVSERFSPIRELDAFDRRMRRMFAGFPFPLALMPPLAPAADVYETDEEFVFELEVPGYEEKELSVEISDHTLAIKGAHARTKDEKTKEFALHERVEREFERRFILPSEADMEHVKAAFTRGVLEVHAQKLQAAQPTKVMIANS